MSPGPEGVLLTGGLGVGKSAVAIESHAVLSERGLPSAFVDLDHLAWAEPDPASGETVASLIAANLRAVLPAFERAGIRFFLLARAVTGQQDVDAVRAAFGHPLAVARVRAPRDVAEARMHARDVGSELRSNLAALDLFEETAGEDFEVPNDGRPVREVALELLDRLGWVTIAP